MHKTVCCLIKVYELLQGVTGLLSKRVKHKLLLKMKHFFAFFYKIDAFYIMRKIKTLKISTRNGRVFFLNILYHLFPVKKAG